MQDARVTLDFPARDGAGDRVDRLERLRFGRPRRILEARTAGEVRPALRAAEAASREGAWVVACVAYEAAPAFDPALAVRPHEGPAPLAWFAVLDPPVLEAAPAEPAAPPPRLDWRPDPGRAEWDSAVATIREGIAAGDVYQVNHTLRLAAASRTDGPVDDDVVRAWYDALVARRHGRYHALIRTPRWTVLSASPELFLDVRGRTVTTRPMKGTARRGRWLDEDHAAREALAGSAKDRAENLMIVDLLRNDLGRVARFGTVRVPSLFDVETYPTVLQMTSTITAELRDDVSLEDVFAATFPCGSVTGAPKFTAMRTIARLERSARGPYCGAIGVMRPDGSATFAVAIRTMLIDEDRGTIIYGAGAGITWDSLANAEYDETIAKASLLADDRPPFRLLETMRMDDGRIARMERHLDRLHRSALFFGFPDDTALRARAILERTAAAAPPGAWRLRLLAGRDGGIEIQRMPLHGNGDAHHGDSGAPGQSTDIVTQRIAIAASAVRSDDAMLQHKTTARALYDEHRALHPDCFDVLLFNEHGLITEFCTGNVIVEIGGRCFTPPRECGLLPGTFRQQLLDAGIIRERRITVDELRGADRIWLVNSVREWVPVTLAVHAAAGGTD